MKKEIPIFYACDDRFCKYMCVSICSLIKNSSKDMNYRIFILHSDINTKNMNEINKLQTETVKIEFVSVVDKVSSIGKKLPLRDYYSKTTYYRLFIPELFPNYDKAIYIDSDTIVLEDVSKLYECEIGNNLVGACHEQVMIQNEIFGNYVEKVLGINRKNFFNAGLLLLNCREFRKDNVFSQFVQLLDLYDFVVTQDEDYLNFLCKDRVCWLDDGWNTEVFGNIPVLRKNLKIIHYIMAFKPWHYKDCRLGEYFWAYAKKTVYYETILDSLSSFSEEDKKKDLQSAVRLENLAVAECCKEMTFIQLYNNRFRYEKSANY